MAESHPQWHECRRVGQEEFCLLRGRLDEREVLSFSPSSLTSYGRQESSNVMRVGELAMLLMSSNTSESRPCISLGEQGRVGSGCRRWSELG